ncbi:uncharacterized protein TNCV_3348311 [Trichonephila clavipes]|nr:uncharacterized protein TNCV_3348311 [Trichonephila clavipes]
MSEYYIILVFSYTMAFGVGYRHFEARLLSFSKTEVENSISPLEMSCLWACLAGFRRGVQCSKGFMANLTENSLAVLNHKILEANSQVQNVKLGGHPTCLSINRLWHELCDMLRRLVGTTAPGHHDCSIQE